MPLPSLFSGYIRRTLTLTSSVARRNYHSLDKLATPTLVEPGKCVLNEEWTSLPLLFNLARFGQILRFEDWNGNLERMETSKKD